MSRYPALKIPIPLEYASHLHVDPSHISHVNAGRRRLTILQATMLLEFIRDDPRTEGINILSLRPDIRPAMPYLCRLCPRDRKKARRKRENKKG